MTPNLAELLEQVAAAMRDTRRPTNVQKQAVHVLKAAAMAYLTGDDAVRRADQYAASGYPQGEQAEGRGKGSHSDPTYTAQFARDPFAETSARLKADLRQMDTAATGYLGQLHVVYQQAERTGRESTVAVCAEIHCADPVTEPGRQGRCPNCAKWIYRHRTPGNPWPVVPYEIIEARKIKRRREAA